MFLVITAVSAVSAAGGPGAGAGARADGRPGALDRNGGKDRPPVTTPPPTPAPKGWPHSILTGSAAGCARNPLPYEVIVFRDGNFGGSCAVLVAGFYPYPANFLVGNDAISSIKVGSGVRARAFANPVYGGGWTLYAGGTASAGLGTFDDKISSIRVEPASRKQTCDDLQEGEIALYENVRGQGDCVVLPGDSSYANADAMGIENDSISSITNNSSQKLRAFWHPSFSLQAIEVPAHSKLDTLPGNSFASEGINDNISSIQMVP